MIDLSFRHCEACDSDSPPITQCEIDEFMPRAPGWRVVEVGGTYGKVTVTWWTHKINQLHVNDFIMVSRSL